MLILKVVVGFMATTWIIMTLTWLRSAFEQHCQTKFGFRPLSSEAFTGAGVADMAVWEGARWYQDAISHHGDASNPLVLIALGLLGLAVMLQTRVARTNVFYGVIAAVILAAFGIFAMGVQIVRSMAEAGADRCCSVKRLRD